MERAVSQAALKLRLDRQGDPEREKLKEFVADYLRQLRFSDPEVIETLALECLEWAAKRSSPDLQGILRRALEQAHRLLDRALAQALKLHLPEEAAAVSAAKAALLLACEPICADDLIKPSPAQEALALRLKAHLPLATPPEVPGAMPHQDLEFWL
jgi:AcrR family transcriptional regulator